MRVTRPNGAGLVMNISIAVFGKNSFFGDIGFGEFKYDKRPSFRSEDA